MTILFDGRHLGMLSSSYSSLKAGREGGTERGTKIHSTSISLIWLNLTHVPSLTLSHSFSRKPFLIMLALNDLPILLLCVSLQFVFRAKHLHWSSASRSVSLCPYDQSAPDRIFLIENSLPVSAIPFQPLIQNHLVNLTRVNQCSINELMSDCIWTSLRDKTASLGNFTAHPAQVQLLKGMPLAELTLLPLHSIPPTIHHQHLPSPAQKDSKPGLATSEGTLHINSTRISLLKKGPFCFRPRGPHKLWATVFLFFKWV